MDNVTNTKKSENQRLCAVSENLEQRANMVYKSV